MRSIKAVTVIALLASLFSVALYIFKNNQMASVAAIDTKQVAQPEYDQPLCERLIRLGQVAFDRGQLVEAKHFFQKAITVDPEYALAWKKYNMALLALISARVEIDPSFLPDFSSDGVDSGTPSQIPKDKSVKDTVEDDGC